MAVSTMCKSKCGSSFPFHSFLCHYNHAAYHQLQPSFTSWSWAIYRRTGNLVWWLRFPSAKTSLPILLFQDREASRGEGNSLVTGTEATATVPNWNFQAPAGKVTLHPEHRLTWVQCFQRWSLWSPVPEKALKPRARKLGTIFTTNDSGVLGV